MVDRLQVYCPAQKQGCAWRGERAALAMHKSECAFTRVRCPYGCHTNGLSDDDLSVHMATCSFRTVQCDCDAEITYYDLPAHQARECPETAVSCNVCGSDVKRRLQAAHESACPRQRVPCQHVGFGCSHVCLRQDLDAHLAACPYEAMKGFLNMFLVQTRSYHEKMTEYERVMEQQQTRIFEQERKAQIQDQRIAMLEGQLFEFQRSMVDAPPAKLDRRMSEQDAPRPSWQWSTDYKNRGVTVLKGNICAHASNKDVYQTVRAADPLNREVKLQKFTIKVRAGSGYSWDYGVTNFRFDSRTSYLWNAHQNEAVSYRFAVGPRPTIRMEIDFERMSVTFYENGDRKCEKPLPNWNEYYPTLSMYNAGEVEILDP